ncbi:MAG: hypothetical protein R3C49_10780 [Planctomycetaceae bacterium]
MLKKSHAPSRLPIAWRLCLLMFVNSVLLLPLGPAAFGLTETASGEHWYQIEFDGRPVGYEHLEFRDITSGSERILACTQHLEMKLNRLGQDQTSRSTLTTTQTAAGILKSFHLQRVDAGGNRIDRTGTFDAQNSVFRISERVAATRRDYNIRAPHPAHSPLIGLWLPAACTSPTRTTFPVMYPETAAVADIVARKKTDSTLRLANSPLIRIHRYEFHTANEPTRFTVLSTDSDQTVLREEKLLLGGNLTRMAVSPDVALSSVEGKSLDLSAVDNSDRSAAAHLRQCRKDCSRAVRRGRIPAVTARHPVSTGSTDQ